MSATDAGGGSDTIQQGNFIVQMQKNILNAMSKMTKAYNEIMAALAA